MRDYYELEDQGCCLHCPMAEPGCLCFNCKCSKCEHYSGNDPEHAHEINEDTGGKYCVLVEFWRDQKQREFDKGKRASEFKVYKTIRQSEKAVQCTLINKKTGEVSNILFWIPLSVIIKGHVQNWFADNEIRIKFKGDMEPQRKLF